VIVSRKIPPPELPRARGLLGQEPALNAFRAVLAGGRVGSAYLLHGPEGVGRRRGAETFAAALLCDAPDGIEPCGTCRSCGWNTAGTHPDLLLVSADAGPFFRDDSEASRARPALYTRAHHHTARKLARRSIPVRTLRRLIDLLALTAAGGGRKVALVDSLDEIEEEGAATLLKSLEEPPPGTTFVLLASGTDGVMDTILSRCQRVRFQPLPPGVVRKLLGRDGASPGADAEDLLVRLAQGSAGRALRALDLDVHGAAATAVEGLLDPARPRGVDDALRWSHAGERDLAHRRERVRELVALALLMLRDRAAVSGSTERLERLLPALRAALEAVRANVSPDLVLESLWARVARARPPA
jgi:DNA polymerase-3 subunit delta'